MEKSFKERVAEFWKTFQKKEEEIRGWMDSKTDPDTLVSSMDEILKIAFEESYFEMGFNTKENKYELIMTPEGDRIKLPLLYYWKQLAPSSLSDKWNFHYTRPALAKSDEFSLSMFGVKAGNEDVSVYYQVEEEKQKLDIEVYCKPIENLDEGKKYSFFFILLDQFLGESYTMEYVRYIDFIDQEKEGKSVTLRELKDLIDQKIVKGEWNAIGNPMEVYSAYSMEPPTEESEEEDFLLRSDVFIGYTSCIPLLNSYYNGDSDKLEKYRNNGVVYGFLYYDNTEVPQEEMVPFRGRIEDEIMEQYTESQSVYAIGGATGNYYSYIDFVVFDIEDFLPVVKEIAGKYKLNDTGFAFFEQGAEIIEF